MDIKCKKCEKTLPEEEFHRDGGGYAESICNACRSLRQRSYQHKVSVQEIEQMFARQNGRCPICKRQMTLSGTRHFRRGSRATLHHSHKTEKRLDLLCAKCNSGLGFFNDDADILISAVVYLKSREEEH